MKVKMILRSVLQELVLLSWNIDGLCERGISERFSAVISEIKTINPHVVSV